ncbi:MAG: acyl-CoA/acyl-ACP dehydrogenase [Rhodospirillales bacterium]|nr:acyl-CoA/acyl-ACP dehydrogenase [Rhodospirillales bacterium]
MNFAPTPRQLEIRSLVDDIAARHCTEAQEQERDTTGSFPAGLYAELAQTRLLTLWKEAAAGAGMLNGCVLSEAMGRHSATGSSLIFVSGISAALIARGGSPIANMLLDGLEAGSLKLAFGLTECSAGSDASALSTTAVRDGSDYLIEGEKRYTTGARDADYILAVVRTGEPSGLRPGLSIVAVPTAASGVHITPLDKIAGNGHASCTVRFDQVRVSAEHLIGREDNAWSVLYLGAMIERMAVAASAVGMAQRAYDEAVNYLSQRHSGGHAVTGYQAIQHQLVDLAMQIQAMRSTAYYAAWFADNGTDATAEINMAKVFCVEGAAQVITEAFRLCGGVSYLADSVLYRLWREASLGYFAGGTTEIARNAAARRLGF